MAFGVAQRWSKALQGLSPLLSDFRATFGGAFAYLLRTMTGSSALICWRGNPHTIHNIARVP
jgi:hypothetical protein